MVRRRAGTRAPPSAPRNTWPVTQTYRPPTSTRSCITWYTDARRDAALQRQIQERAGSSKVMRNQIEQSGLLDPKWYFERYPDARELGISAAEHYLRIGASLLRDPGPGFSTAQYLVANPDVKRAGVNPLWHYVVHGRKEGRKIMPSQKSAVLPPAAVREPGERAGAAGLGTEGSNVVEPRYLAMRQDVAEAGPWDEDWYL